MPDAPPVAITAFPEIPTVMRSSVLCPWIDAWLAEGYCTRVGRATDRCLGSRGIGRSPGSRGVRWSPGSRPPI